MPIAFETTPEFTPPGAQSPVCVCVLVPGTHSGQRSFSWLASCWEQTEGEICVGSAAASWPPLDRHRPKWRRPPPQLKRPQSQVKRAQSQVKRPQSKMTLPKTTPRVKRKMQKFFATGVIFHKLWTVYRLRRRRMGPPRPIRELCETRKLGPTVCSRWLGQIRYVNFARLRKGRIWRWWPG